MGDLLTHYPRRHEDRRAFGEFPREESEQPICLCGEVTRTRLNRFGRGKKIFEVTLQESNPHALSQPLVCRWFNLHYVQKMILTGQRLVVFGKPRQRGQRICMEHPNSKSSRTTTKFRFTSGVSRPSTRQLRAFRSESCGD